MTGTPTRNSCCNYPTVDQLQRLLESTSLGPPHPASEQSTLRLGCLPKPASSACRTSLAE